MLCFRHGLVPEGFVTVDTSSAMQWLNNGSQETEMLLYQLMGAAVIVLLHLKCGLTSA
jgi:hypothetical protein